MYLVSKEHKIDKKDRSSYSKLSKLLTKVLGDSEEILRYDGMRKKMKCGKGSSYICTEYKKVCVEVQVKVLVEKQEFKEKFRNLERKLLTKNEGLTITPNFDDKKVYDDILKSLSYIKAIEKQISIQVY